MENIKKTILLFPFSRPLRSGGFNPKNPPVSYWLEIVKGLKEKGYYIIQMGIDGEVKLEGIDEYKFNLPLKEIEKLMIQSYNWISIDSFAPHLAYLINKPGIVIFSQSDPLIFGHTTNTNLLKDRSYLREGVQQFWWWEQCNYKYDAFIEPSKVLEVIP
uniref:Glycosyltransferase n=1 Tax=viral metagenome TaxID=1070528 RepID=A0A6M3IJQ4_9ZZZZ